MSLSSIVSLDGRPRCSWCLSHPLYIAYHDDEWGVPQHDDTHLFEMLVLEGAQAGLSWLTILKRREAYRRAFENWNAERVARYGVADRARLLGDAGIVRNRLKVDSAISNAGRFLDVAAEFGSFDAYLWRFTEGRTLRPARPWQTLSDVPCESAESRALSKDLARRGFRFVRPVIMYSFMQACGLVDDHLAGCFRCAATR
jgi:DNA-3-methyladenine glycosylase I